MPFILVALLFASQAVYAGDPERLATQEIRRIQQVLRSEGFDPGPVDGIVGPLTRGAVRQFQKKNRLPVTGKLDQRTRQRLAKAYAEHAPAPPENLRVIEQGEE